MMKFKSIYLSFFILLIALCSCSDNSTSPDVDEPAFEFPAEITIAYGETIQLPGRDLKITFADVPADYRFWEHYDDWYEVILFVSYRDYEPFNLHIAHKPYDEFVNRAFYFSIDPVALELTGDPNYISDLSQYRFSFTIDSIDANSVPNLGGDAFYSVAESPGTVSKDSFELLDVYIVNDTLNAEVCYQKPTSLNAKFEFYVYPWDLLAGSTGSHECSLVYNSRGYNYFEDSVIDTVKINLLPIAETKKEDRYLYIYGYNGRNLRVIFYDGPY